MSKCYICGKELEDIFYRHNFLGHFESICRNCFESIYWLEVLNDPNTVIIEGIAYHVSENDDNGFGRTIELLEGGTYENVKLWLNGKVPEEYQAKDNAKFRE